MANESSDGKTNTERTMLKEAEMVEWLPPAEAVEWLVAANAAIQWLAAGCTDPEAAEAKIRAVWVDEYQQAGRPIPEWLRGPEAKAFLDRLEGSE